MSLILNKWRIYCSTENQWVYEWRESTNPPTLVCFTNNTHTINENSLSIVDVLDSKEVIVKEESTKTQGNFRTEGFKFDIPAQNEYTHDISFDYPINLLAVWFNVTSENIGDQLTVEFQPPYAGTIIADITSPTSSIQVDLVTANLVNIGYGIILKRDSDNYMEHLGEVLAINKTTGVLTVSTSTIDTFSIGDNVYFRVSGVKDVYLSSAGRHSIGTSKLGATFIMTGGVFYAHYTNNTPESTKKFFYELEYLY